MAQAAKKEEEARIEAHDAIISELATYCAPLLETSREPMFLYLDDAHKVCNEPLARLFGYEKNEWERKEPFLNSFVAADQRSAYSKEYNDIVVVGRSSLKGTVDFVRRDGSSFRAQVATIPLMYKGEVCSLNLLGSTPQKAPENP